MTHLSPSSKPVAIRTQKSEVARIGSPVFKPIRPNPSLLEPQFLSGINMVNIQNAVVINSAAFTLAAKVFDKSKFSLPITWMLVDGMTMLRPVSIPAFVRAKPVLAILAASFAGRGSFPASRQITCLSAVLSGSFSKPIQVHFKCLLTVLTGAFYSGLFHCASISEQIEPKYFDIACRRIEDAQRQGRLIA